MSFIIIVDRMTNLKLKKKKKNHTHDIEDDLTVHLSLIWRDSLLQNLVAEFALRME